jgi:hydrogenase expression/formation protein HypC
MCLAIPGKVIETYEEAGLAMGKIDFNGSLTEACLAYVPEAEVGSWVYVHAGFAINILNEEEAEKVFETWKEFEDRVNEMDEPPIQPMGSAKRPPEPKAGN